VTPKDRLAQLVAAGCVLEMHEPAVGEFALAAAVLHGNVLRWCALFPVDQSHVHNVKFDDVRLEAGGRDLAFYRKGSLVAYVGPPEEFDLDLKEYQTSWNRWKEDMADPDTAETFNDFFQYA
jgi:hypothetical protein